MARPGAFHQICGNRTFPIYYHTHYTSKAVPKTKRIVGLFWCPYCEVATYAVDWRIPKPGESKQKMLEEMV